MLHPFRSIEVSLNETEARLLLEVLKKRQKELLEEEARLVQGIAKLEEQFKAINQQKNEPIPQTLP